MKGSVLASGARPGAGIIPAGQRPYSTSPFGTFAGGARVTGADLTGDGKPDLIITPDESGGPRMIVLQGGTRSLPAVASFFGIDDPAFRGGARAAAGDINGDGFADVVGGGPGGGLWVLALSGNDLLTKPAAFAAVLANFFGDSANRGGVPLTVKDLDGDPFADLVIGNGPGAGTRVTSFQGRTLSRGAPQQIAAFDAFGGFNTGVFIG